ncbi:MAG TPA: extracellular solute-binding protein [Chloroflexota bacterium]|nr:extracellular solute-binding protein [Chloroflexota bacterium]
MRTACLRSFPALCVAAALLLSACGGAASPASPSAAAPSTAAPASAAAKPASQTAKPGASGAGSPAASGGTTLQGLIDGAKKEGALQFAYGGGTLGGNEGIAKLGDAFNKAYGLDLQIQLSPGDSMPNMVAKITQEYQANKPASTDVVLSLADTMNTPIEAHSVYTEDWRSWGPNIQKVQSPDVTTPDGSAVVIQTFMSGIAYNTNKVPKDQVPTNMQDLLKPQFKGKMSSTVYATAFDWMATDAMWGYDKTLDYVKKFSQQLAGVMRCGEDDRVASGEFDVFALSCSQTGILKLKNQKGAPVDYVVPSDAILEEYVYAAVPKTAQHPNAAKLWIDWLNSPEAQKIMGQNDFTDSNLIPGSVSGKLLADAEAKAGSTKATVASVQYAKDHYLPNGPKYKDEFTKILTGK